MKTKFIGPILIAALSVLTFLIWFLVRQGTPMFADYSVATHSLGQIAGLIGLTLFALTFVFTTRLKIVEDSFGGLDKVYQVHHLLGSLSFILILFHPLLLVIKFIPSNWPLAAKYLLPSSSVAVNLGITALLAMIILIALTIYINLKYETWKGSHRLFGFVFIIAFFHSFMITSDISRYNLLKFYMLFICALGIISFVYGSFIRPKIKDYPYKLKDIKSRGNVTILELEPINEKIAFKPGQFVFLKTNPKEQHPFTIASSPEENNIVLMIKSLGDYTSKIKELKKGTLVSIEGPYGKMWEELSSSQKPQVWIAGGIGITPFSSFVSHIAKTKSLKQKIDLFYCTSNNGEAFLLETLLEQAKAIPNLRIHDFCSADKGRIDLQKIESVVGKIEGKKFVLCGPLPMMESISKQLKQKGFSKNDILYENFNLK
ncbi:Sulfhydrogenase 2 subunit gamma [uncultured archaeon]|nr:Sulfhydrogenase 2 subunit gamma [uncultured archaeon]